MPQQPAAPAPEPHSLEQRIARSTVASYAIQLVRLLVGFGAKVVLARLLLPEVHGLYEEGLRVVTIAAAVRDLGLPYHLVRDERRPYGTVFAIVNVLAFVLTFGLVAAAPLFHRFDPMLPLVVTAFAVWVILDGLAVVPRACFERELTIGDLVAPELVRTLAVALVAIGLARLGWGVAALVVADLAGAALFAILARVRARGRYELRAEPAIVPDLLRRSSALFLIWVVFQLVTYIDVFIVGFFRTTDDVGFYARAFWLPFLVSSIVYPRALFPTLVAYRDDAARFADSFRFGVVQLLAVQVPAAAFFVLNAEKVIEIVAGPGWEPAAPLLRILAFSPVWIPFLGGELLKAHESDRTWLAIESLNLVSLFVAGVVLTHRFGAPGMAAANYLVVGNLVLVGVVARRLGRRARALARDLVVVHLVPAPFFAAAALLFPAASWERFAASIVAAALGLGAVVLVYWRPFRAYLGRRPATAPLAATEGG